MLARRFLWIVAIVAMLVIAGAFIYRLFGHQIMQVAMVPTVPFEESPKDSGPDYTQIANWLARPEIELHPGLWTPEGYQPAPKPGAVVFYVAPTAYLSRDRWNAPLHDPEDEGTNNRLAIYLRGQASVFNGVASIYAPRYRQATFGAFLTSKQDALHALDLAYSDVSKAFDTFLATVSNDRPIILAAHSQGSLHLLRLLQEKVAGKPVANRIVAAYVVGWPVSQTTDVPALGLPQCTRRDQAGCLLSWQSFAEPADPSAIIEVYDATPGLNGQPRRGTDMVCTNPLTGGAEAEAPREANLGALVPTDARISSAKLKPRHVGARCEGRGFLMIGEAPEGFDYYVLPGNNYHVYDYALFWANLRADVEARLNAYLNPVVAAAAAE